MQKNIQIRGLNYNSNNHLTADGDLQVAMNLINESGSLIPIGLPDTVATLEEGAVAIYIHVTDDFTHYIIYKDSKLYYTADFENYTQLTSTTYLSEPTVTSLNNTLIINLDVIEYVYYSDEEYKYLGTKPPVPKLSFALDGEFESSADYSLSKRTFIDDYSTDSENINLEDVGGEDETDQSEIDSFVSYLTSPVLAQANKFVTEKGTKENKFIFPFLVRYAIKLYDGSYTMHSYPVLMTPFSGVTPKVILPQFITTTGDPINGHSDTTVYSLKIRTSALVCTLRYKMLGFFNEFTQVATDDMDNWKDLITSIDIFVSAPQYTYDQSGSVYGWEKMTSPDSITGFSLSKLTNSSSHNSTKAETYAKRSFSQLFDYYDAANNDGFYSPFNGLSTGTSSDGETLSFPTYLMRLPEKDLEIDTESLFYKISSINVDDLTTSDSFIDVDIDDNVLTNLQVQQTLDDDFKTHSIYKAGAAYTYNSRLNIGDITEYIYNGMPVDTQFTYLDKTSTTTPAMKIFVYLKKEGKEYIVETPSSSLLDSMPYYIYYPDTDAYKVIIDINGETVSEFKLTQHTLLNGSYYFNNYTFSAAAALTPTATTDNTVRYSNYIYTTNVNNPFIFPSLLMNTVGTGTVKQLVSATLALSEGQFGAFPLHAFTTEGIWALQTSSDGGYSSIQPISRDILKGEVLQLDQTLMFTTERGVLLLSGANVQVTSTILDNLILPTYARIDDIQSALGINLPIPSDNIYNYLDDCNLSYDYINQRIYICNPNFDYSYLYSLKSGLWSCSTTTFDRTLASYPVAVVCENNVIYKFTHSANATNTDSQLLITRGLQLDAPNAYKTIRDIFTRADVYGTDINIALFGSNDGIEYIPIATSTTGKIHLLGSPYKYFAILSAGVLDNRDSIAGYEIEYDIKRTNKLR